MAETVKNIGVVAAGYAGTTAPTNKDLIWIDTSTPARVKKIYNYTTSIWEPHVSGVTSLVENLVANGTDLGGIANGTTVPAGTSLESVLRQATTKAVSPTYVQPSVSLDIVPYSEKVEAGTTIGHSLEATFFKNDAGIANNVVFKKNVADIYSDNLAPYYFLEPNYQISDGTVNYKATANYNEGATKSNNLASPDPTGKILAGSIDSEVTPIKGCRKAFYGVNKDLSIDGSIVRTLQNNILDPANETTFTITIPSGTTKVQFAYPASLRSVNVIKYVEGGLELKRIFKESSLNVPGENGFLAIAYRVYEYMPDAPFSTAVQYEVTI